MVFSYYDSFITRFEKDEKIKKDKDDKRSIVELIFAGRDKQLSPRGYEALKWIQKLKLLRNNVTHNNEGTHRNEEDIRELCNDNEEISFNDNSISISGPKLILKTLEEEYIILLELCEILGYKKMRYPTS